MDLEKIILILKQHGVLRFRGYGIDIELAPGYSAPQVSASSPVVEVPKPKEIKEIKPEEAPIGPIGDFKGDELMAFDKILNWSASPDPEDDGKESIPLTGDAPLLDDGR